MERDERFDDPNSSQVAVWYVVGVVIGGVIALPAIQSALGIVTVGDFGPIGRVLLVGVLSIMTVTIGLVGLYQLFILVDK